MTRSLELLSQSSDLETGGLMYDLNLCDPRLCS